MCFGDQSLNRIVAGVMIVKNWHHYPDSAQDPYRDERGWFTEYS